MKKSGRHQKAVALAYRPASDMAPKVTAKGRGKVAEKIIEIARRNGVHIHEDPDMVDALCDLHLHEEIPEDLYKVVAELLAFLYSLEGKKGPI